MLLDKFPFLSLHDVILALLKFSERDRAATV